MNMNGINYSSLFTNTNPFGKASVLKEEQDTKVRNKVTGTKERREEKRKNQDSVEISGAGRELSKAIYEKPRMAVTQKSENAQDEYKLSDNAQKLLEELKEKYSNMEFRVMRWSSDEEEDYYARKCEKDFSVLIDPDALEAMAADEEVRAKYESVLEGATSTSDQLKEELGEDAAAVKNFTVSIDRDGKVSYSLQLIENFKKANEERAKAQKDSLEKAKEEKREESKKADADRIKADSLEELIEKVKSRLAEKKEPVKVEE